MSKQLQDLHEQVERTHEEKPKKRRRTRPDAWPKEAEDILDRDYANVPMTILVLTLQPHFERIVTPNMIFGKANRMNIAGRLARHKVKLLPQLDN